MSEIWSECGQYLTGYGLMVRTDDYEDLLYYIENGHPSIDETHHCYKALQELGDFTESELLQLWNSIKYD